MQRRLAYLSLFAVAALVVWRFSPPSDAPDEPSAAAPEPAPLEPPAAAPAAPSQPERAQTDAGVQRFEVAPAQPAALEPGQALREVQDLVNQNRIGAARALAERHLRGLPPDGPEARQIMSLTGVHPHP